MFTTRRVEPQANAFLDQEVVAKRKNGSFSARVRTGASVFLSMLAIFYDHNQKEV